MMLANSFDGRRTLPTHIYLCVSIDLFQATQVEGGAWGATCWTRLDLSLFFFVSLFLCFFVFF